MNKSKLVEFQQFSQDFLRLLGEKTRHAERNKDAAKELAILEYFWNNCEALIRRYELDILEATLLAVNSQVKSKLLDHDMRDLLNEVYRVRHKIGPDEIARIMSRKSLPTRDQLMKDVQIKNSNAS